MIKFQSFLSGSSGNCTFVTNSYTKLLVDCGANGRYIEECLDRIGVLPQEIDAILISHGHRDHVSGAGVVSRRFDIPIYASQGTWEEMTSIIGNINTTNTKIIDLNDDTTFGDIKIRPFSIPHDAKGALAYRIETENSKMAIATDIGHISDEIFDNLRGCDFVIIEANHDLEMLRNGRYPYYLKKRIMSDTGHLSNNDCGKLCAMLAKTGTKSFWLGHLSNENNTCTLAYNTVKETLLSSNVNVGSDVCLNVLPRFWLE